MQSNPHFKDTLPSAQEASRIRKLGRLQVHETVKSVVDAGAICPCNGRGVPSHSTRWNITTNLRLQVNMI